MQLNVVQASSPMAFDMMIYPNVHPGTYQYLQNQFSNLSATILDSGRQFLEQGRAMVQKFCDGSLERAARATIRMAKTMLNPNAIQYYSTLEDIQAASPLMQRYIMSDVYLRGKYEQQLCSGYSGSYIDMDPGLKGEDHYDWRRVNNGIVQFDDTTDKWKSTTYFEDLREGDRDLRFDEQIDILNTQQIARMFAMGGDDPTCPFGSKIG